MRHRYTVAAAPAAAWRALGRPGRWWPAAHTWSGDSKHLSLALEAGGCFCERWSGGSVEHGRVVMARKYELLRLDAALGPLQELAVTAVLTIDLASTDGATEATVIYRVSGTAAHALDQLAPAVDKVIGEQFARFAAYAGKTTSAPK